MQILRDRLALFAVLAFILITLGGCTEPQRKPVPPGPGPVPPDNVPRMQVKPTPERTAEENRDVAADITRKAEAVQGVERAFTVVVGNTVLIGIDMKETKQEQGIAAIKDSVAAKAEADARIVRAYVSSDPDTTARIREISDNVRKGRPVTEYLDEIGEIIQRLTPKTD